MSRARQTVPTQTLDSPVSRSAPEAWPAGLQPMMLAQRAGGGGNAFAQSLIGPALSGALGACFGPAAQRISIQGGQDAPNQAIGALASSAGRRVSLSSQVDPAGGDRQSLEILGHEVAHALAGGGSGETELDQPGDPGEARADQAGARFADWIEADMAGPAPRLQAATGGRARVHRWEGAEHLDAVDGAVDRLTGAGEEVDPGVAATMQQPVTLGNGMELTPGQVTALMGDFYGAFDKDGNFDVDASFEQLWNADPKEMQGLLDVLARERAGAVVSPNEWESVTAGRRDTGALTYLDLADRNTNHFSAPTMEGTDNNMGTYTALHERALAEAARGNPESANRARALEAAANHYLTDRFSAGHQFDKDAMMASTAHSPDGLAANVHAKWTHDQMNEAGVEVHSGGASPEAWRALGDGHWGEKGGDGNAMNRLKTAGAVYTSYQELDAVLQGQATPGQLSEGGYAAYDKVPQWEPDRQRSVEAGNHTLDATVSGDAAMFTPYVDEGLSILAGRYIVGPTRRAASAVAGAIGGGAAVAGEAVNDYQESLDEYGLASPKPGYE